MNWIKLDIPIRWELNEREITDVKESVENLAGIIDRLKRGHNVRDYKNFATPEILRSPALSRSRDENDKSVSKYNSKDDFKMDRSTASSQPNGIIPKSNVQDIKSKSELFWKDLGYELEQEIRQSYYKYAPTVMTAVNFESDFSYVSSFLFLLGCSSEVQYHNQASLLFFGKS